MKSVKLRLKRRHRLLFIFGTALILLISLGIALFLQSLFLSFGMINLNSPETEGVYWIVIFGLTSAIIGTVLAFILSRIILTPVYSVIEGMEKLSDGDFSTRIELGKSETLQNVSNSFNKLARELEKTEILRSDFISDFTHEIKTPIMSISALVSLLKTKSVSDEKYKSYLEVMESEAKRLVDMTTNTLYLSKLESQEIITDKKKYNVSEQIRGAVLMFVSKWEEKNLSLSVDVGEISLCANEDMMMQVWVNLIDNAIKFSECGKELKIDATAVGDILYVNVENHGPEIPEEDYEKIFTKFFQCDKSRTTEGNGIGLSVVKHIVELHGGEVKVSCENGVTCFSVALPIN